MVNKTLLKSLKQDAMAEEAIASAELASNKTENWEEEFNAIINEWKEPYYCFERHDALIDYMNIVIKKMKLLIEKILKQQGEENFHSTCPTCKKLIPNKHFDCEREMKEHFLKQQKLEIKNQLLSKGHGGGNWRRLIMEL
jgi:hypothetical protein